MGMFSTEISGLRVFNFVFFIPNSTFASPRACGKNGRGSQQSPELLNAHARVAHNRAHGVGVHRIVARHNDMKRAFGHEDVLALAINAEARFFQRLHGAQVIDARQLRHITR